MKTKLCFLGQHDTRNNEFKLHTHDCYEIIYFASGSGSVRIGDMTFPVAAHSCCIVPPQCEHTEQLGQDSKIMFIGFEYSSDGRELTGTVFQHAEIGTLFQKLFSEYKQQAVGYEVAIDSLLKLMLTIALRAVVNDGSKCKNLDYVKNYIEQYHGTKIDFGELAVISGYSYDYFRNIFKKRFGISPQGYLMDIRLSNAKYMLENTELSCTEIAYKCGFSNSAQPSMMFKKKFGVSPSAIK